MVCSGSAQLEVISAKRKNDGMGVGVAGRGGRGGGETVCIGITLKRKKKPNNKIRSMTHLAQCLHIHLC